MTDRIQRDKKTGTWMRYAARTLIVLSIGWMLILPLVNVRPRDIGQWLLFNWHVTGILMGLFLSYRAKQFLARASPAEVIEDPRPPVVYLRLFRKDAGVLGRVLPGLLNPGFILQNYTTFEEQLAQELAPIGPMVALAHPERNLPAVGAARYHVPNAQWQDLVTRLLGEARLVILRPGPGQSMAWELERAADTLPPEKLLLLFHGSFKRQYAETSDWLQARTGHSLPKRPRRSAFVAFEKEWQPQVLPLHAPAFHSPLGKPMLAPLHYALRPVFKAEGIDWQPLPLSRGTIAIIAVPVLMILSIFVLTQFG